MREKFSKNVKQTNKTKTIMCTILISFKLYFTTTLWIFPVGLEIGHDYGRKLECPFYFYLQEPDTRIWFTDSNQFSFFPEPQNLTS